SRYVYSAACPDGRRVSVAWLYPCLDVENAPTLLYAVSLRDALPISMAGMTNRVPARAISGRARGAWAHCPMPAGKNTPPSRPMRDRKSTRLNSSHVKISYAVFCLKKKKSTAHEIRQRLRCESAELNG